MTRKELEKIVEENDYLYVLIVNGGILRATDFAYFGGLTEESAMAYFESIKDQLGPNPVVETTKLELTDISALSALYMRNDYKAFFIAEYGIIPTELLFTYRQNIIEELRDLLLSLPSEMVYFPLNNQGAGIVQTIEKKNIVQSFYTSEDELLKHEPTEEYTILPMSLVDILGQARGFGPHLFTLNDTLISGYEFMEILRAYFKEILMTGEEIKNIIDNSDFYYWKRKDNGAFSFACNLPLIFASRETAEKYCDEFLDEVDILPFNSEETFKEITEDSNYIAIDTGEGDFKYCYTYDFALVRSGYDIQKCKKNVHLFAREFAKTPKLYILTPNEGDHKGKLQAIGVSENMALLPVFSDLEEAKKFLQYIKLPANISIVDNNTEQNFIKMLTIAYAKKFSTVQICEKAPTNQEVFNQSPIIPTPEFLNILGIYNTDIPQDTENESDDTFRTVFSM